MAKSTVHEAWGFLIIPALQTETHEQTEENQHLILVYNLGQDVRQCDTKHTLPWFPIQNPHLSGDLAMRANIGWGWKPMEIWPGL